MIRSTVEVCWRTVTVIADAVPEIGKACFMNAFPKTIFDLGTRTFPKCDFLFDGISTNFNFLAIGKSIIIEINVINDESRKIKIKFDSIKQSILKIVKN